MLSKLSTGFSIAMLACMTVFFLTYAASIFLGEIPVEALAVTGAASIAMASFAVPLMLAEIVRMKPQFV